MPTEEICPQSVRKGWVKTSEQSKLMTGVLDNHEEYIVGVSFNSCLVD